MYKYIYSYMHINKYLQIYTFGFIWCQENAVVQEDVFVKKCLFSDFRVKSCLLLISKLFAVQSCWDSSVM